MRRLPLEATRSLQQTETGCYARLGRVQDIRFARIDSVKIIREAVIIARSGVGQDRERLVAQFIAVIGLRSQFLNLLPTLT